MEKINCGVSIVICCHNSEKKLPEAIRYVALQKVSKPIAWEVLIIDNASTDNTSQAALKIWQEYSSMPLRVIYESQLGLNYGRQRGLLESQYEFVSFIDDDNWIYPDWVEKVFEIMSSYPDAGALGGLNEVASAVKLPEWFEKHSGAYAIGVQADRSGYMPKERNFLWGAGLIVRKSAYQGLVDGGFRHYLIGRQGKSLSSGEDVEMTLALRLAGWRLMYDSRLRLKHFISADRLEWGYLRRLHRVFGKDSVTLDIYQRFLSAEKELISKSWIIIFLIVLRNMIFNYRLFIFKAFLFLCEGNMTALGVEGRMGVLSELLRLRKKYNERFDAIGKFYKNLNKAKDKKC